MMSGFTIYNHPRDFPDKFVARQWVSAGGAVIMGAKFFAHEDLSQVRKWVRAQIKNPVVFDRNLNDDSVIMETWL